MARNASNAVHICTTKHHPTNCPEPYQSTASIDSLQCAFNRNFLVAGASDCEHHLTAPTELLDLCKKGHKRMSAVNYNT